jgi:hypothetical protein
MNEDERTPVSVFKVDCECGAHIRSHTRETVCPNCGRILVIEWPAKYEGQAL